MRRTATSDGLHGPKHAGGYGARTNPIVERNQIGDKNENIEPIDGSAPESPQWKPSHRSGDGSMGSMAVVEGEGVKRRFWQMTSGEVGPSFWSATRSEVGQGSEIKGASNISFFGF